MDFDLSLLPISPETRATAITDARDLANSPAGQALARDLADSGAGRQLALALVDSPTARDRAEALATSVTGQALAHDLADSPAGQALARDLADSGAGRQLALALAGSPGGRQLALVMVTSRTGQNLAINLATSVTGQTLVQDLVDSPTGRQLARALADIPTGQTLARTLTDTGTGQTLARTLADSGTGRDLARALADSAAGQSLARTLATSGTGQTLAQILADSLVETIGAVVIMATTAPVLALGLGGAMAATAMPVVFVAAAITRTNAESGSEAGEPGTSPDEPLDLRSPNAQRYRIRFDVGPNASMEEITQVLQDLSTVFTVASIWAEREVQLHQEDQGNSGDDRGGRTLTVAPPEVVIDQGAEEPAIERITYRNPLEVIASFLTGASGAVAAGGGTAVALLEIVRRWRTDTADRQARESVVEAEAAKLYAEAEAAKISAQADADKASAEARSINAATDRAAREEIAGLLAQIMEGSGFRVSNDEVMQMIANHPDLIAALARLSRYPIEIEQIDPTIDPGELT